MAFRSDRTDKSRGGGTAPRLILGLALAALLLRNVPLCWLMPLWSFGDEMGHLDCAMKWNRGHIPQARDKLEPILFKLYRARADQRYLTATPVPRVKKIEHLGIGGYTYEAKHPPLPYWIMAVFIRLFKNLGISLLVQVKLFRMISLGAMVGGIVVLYRGLRKDPRLGTVFYAPLLFIGLLAQDMYFSINTDTFSFLFGAVAFSGIMAVFRSPQALRGWLLLSAGTILMMWTKASNLGFFVLWGVLGVLLLMKGRDRRASRLFAASLLIVVLLSSPFYIYNQVRFSNPFQASYADLFGPNPYVPAGLSLHSAVVFLEAYTRTLFRGEMIWNGRFFDIFDGVDKSLVLTWFPFIVFLAGLAWGASRRGLPERPLEPFLLGAGTLVPAALAMGYFFLGMTPYYQLRLSLSMVYPVLFVFGLGWKALLRGDNLSLAVPSTLLLIYNAAHTFIMLGKVLA